MSETSTKVKKKAVWSIVKRIFPDYTGLKFRIVYTDKVTFWNTNWCEGTRSYYGGVQLDTGKSRNWVNMPAPWNNPIEGQTFELLPDVAIIEHEFFCGKDCGITVHLHPTKQLDMLA